MALGQAEEGSRLHRLRVTAASSSNARAASRRLSEGLRQFNLEQAGPFRYKREVLCAREGKGRLLGGLIMQSYWHETFVELLWLSAPARGQGLGAKLIERMACV